MLSHNHNDKICPLLIKGAIVQQLSPEELASFKELLISNMIEIQAIAHLLFEKGIIKQREYDVKLKHVQSEPLSESAWGDWEWCSRAETLFLVVFDSVGIDAITFIVPHNLSLLSRS